MKKLFFVLLVLVCLISSCKKAESNKYTVTFYNNGEVYKEIVYEENANVEFDVLTKEGYTFLGWSLNGEIVENHKVIADVQFEAEFKIKNYEVSFNNDGDVSVAFYDYGQTINFPTLEKAGYKFEGWSLDNEIVTSHIVTGTVTFIAVYSELDLIGETEQFLVNNYPEETIENLELPTEYKGVSITWTTSNSSAISKTGEVKQQEYKATVTLTAKLSYNGESKNVKIKVVVPKLDDEVILNNVLNSYEFNDEIVNNKFNLVTDFSTLNSKIYGTWKSSEEDVVANDGTIKMYFDCTKNVELTLTITLREASASKTFNVELPVMDYSELVELAIQSANIDTYVTSSHVSLPTKFEYNLTGDWESSDTSIIDNQGNVLVSNNTYKEVTMTLTLYKENNVEVKKMTYTFKVHNKAHLPIIHAADFVVENMNKVKIENNRLVLAANETYGEYESEIIDVISFNNLVPSWSAVTSKEATVEFLVKARVNGSWSKYISYCSGGWGLGLQNKSYDTSDSLVKLSTDEFMILNSKSADAVQFKLILRRSSANVESPKVSLVALALKGTNYSAPTYDLNTLPSYVKHDVPKLYQGAVPSIGNSICSPTSSTMLLKSKGMDFSEFDSQYEHRYIAGLARDYGNAIYGNWVYNTVTMGAYGFNSYVARFYSVEELCHHIATVGPVACSMKGQMTSDMKDYYTAGHLITIIGFEYKDGVLTLISNDPNVPSVECRYSRTVFTNTWRNISYVIE